ncbi:Fe-S protein assembly co-chaperone HscB [Mucilaginibacter paludis]|uniref:Co-chaperone Hsc20 n=1 Tax=Mucilaginibacter paludis DSM 18603 TaxID=714943 RepID=H1YCK0_9SPHI|nr:Fe-S protein assembly co-chaperone HscB [Mucilaginibacter paludis]EHQ30678.1 co-chaperone Hsc20 [Mucilaginibacter paludis DSM 18603]
MTTSYFEFYGLPESFTIDAKVLKNKFYELSKRYHPDFYANESEARQQEILELSTLNNKAYQVLSNPPKLTEYILQQHGLLAEGDKHQLAPDFLMEMMEINENLMEVDDEAGLLAIKTQLAGIENDLNAQLSSLIKNYETDNQANKITTLKNIKDIYFKQKYLLRIKDSLNTFAARF